MTTPTGSVDGQIDDLDKLLLEARTDEYGDSGNYNEAKLKQLILARESVARINELNSLITRLPADEFGHQKYVLNLKALGGILERIAELQSLPNTTKDTKLGPFSKWKLEQFGNTTKEG